MTTAHLDRDDVLRAVDLRVLPEDLGTARGVAAPGKQFPCPVASHEQSGRTPPATVADATGGYGLWKCHSCGAGGTALVALIAAGGVVDVAGAFAGLATGTSAGAAASARTRTAGSPVSTPTAPGVGESCRPTPRRWRELAPAPRGMSLTARRGYARRRRRGPRLASRSRSDRRRDPCAGFGADPAAIGGREQGNRCRLARRHRGHERCAEHVQDGDSEVDESTVTGESLPVHKAAGNELIGATINRNGTLHARATAVGSDTALAQIVKLVQEAQNSKAPGQRLADRAAFWLVLVALIGGAVTFAVWYFVVGRDVQEALLLAITVVVITCPDALGLATPTAIMVGSGLGARRGILFKHALALEQAAALDTVVLDKTGMLTRGEPEVVEVATAGGVDEDELLALVAGAERESEHPFAQAVVNAARARSLTLPAATSFEAVPGQGAIAVVDGHRLAIGNLRLLEREQISLDGLGPRAAELAGEGRTTVQVAIDGQIAGLIAIADAPPGLPSCCMCVMASSCVKWRNRCLSISGGPAKDCRTDR